MAEESRVNGGVKTILGEESEIPRYYQVGRRPLDSPLGDELYGGIKKIAHWQFVSPDGGNFGYTTGNRIFSEDASKHHYHMDTPEFGTMKFNAECIDEAKKQVADKWKEQSNAVDIVPPFSGFPEKVAPFTKYDLLSHHCQDFIKEVVKQAEKVAKKKGVPLIVEDRDWPARTDPLDPGRILYPDMVQSW